jgi:hypothetical protein
MPDEQLHSPQHHLPYLLKSHNDNTSTNTFQIASLQQAYRQKFVFFSPVPHEFYIRAKLIFLYVFTLVTFYEEEEQ